MIQSVCASIWIYKSINTYIYIYKFTNTLYIQDVLVSSSSWWFLTWLKTIRQLMLNGKSPQFFGWKQDIACNHHLASASFISFKCQWHYWHPKLFHGCIQSSTNGNSLPEKRSMDIFDCGKTSSCQVKWIKKSQPQSESVHLGGIFTNKWVPLNIWNIHGMGEELKSKTIEASVCILQMLRCPHTTPSNVDHQKTSFLVLGDSCRHSLSTVILCGVKFTTSFGDVWIP